MVSVTLQVYTGEKMLIARNEELGIVTQGKDWNDLMKNIRDIVVTYFNVKSANSVRILLDIEPVTK